MPAKKKKKKININPPIFAHLFLFNHRNRLDLFDDGETIRTPFIVYLWNWCAALDCLFIYFFLFCGVRWMRSLRAGNELNLITATAGFVSVSCAPCLPLSIFVGLVRVNAQVALHIFQHFAKSLNDSLMKLMEIDWRVGYVSRSTSLTSVINSTTSNVDRLIDLLWLLSGYCCYESVVFCDCSKEGH